MTDNNMVTGSDEIIGVQCYDEDSAGVQTKPNLTGATITAVFVRNGTKLMPTTSWSCSSGTTGADWSTGLVAISIANTDWSAITATTDRSIIVEIKRNVSGNIKFYRSSLEDAIKIYKAAH